MLSIGTVAFHKYGTMEKLSMTNKAEFINYGLMRCMPIA
jgi:DNA-binding CsgD family transcriptional regulator